MQKDFFDSIDPLRKSDPQRYFIPTGPSVFQMSSFDSYSCFRETASGDLVRSRLAPGLTSPVVRQAMEKASLAGGVGALVSRGRELMAQENLELGSNTDTIGNQGPKSGN
jgi:hypothetical protein